MKPSLSRHAAKIVFLLFLVLLADLWQQLTWLALGLDRCAVRGNERRSDQTPKPVIPSSAQRSWFKASNGIDVQGPAGGGKDAVYSGCELEPMEWSATKAMICSGKVFSRLVFSSFCFGLFCSSIFWLSTTFAVRTRALSYGARFKLLSVGAGS
jgi:hypothetical protein